MTNAISWFEIPTTHLDRTQPTAPKVSEAGTLVYLDASPSLDAALTRVLDQGGSVVMPRLSLTDDLGVIAHIHDLDGNRAGLHALA
ncbi:MAG: hypothetical protein ABI434_02280 [Burkholderiaceae bacterium]